MKCMTHVIECSCDAFFAKAQSGVTHHTKHHFGIHLELGLGGALGNLWGCGTGILGGGGLKKY